MDRFFRQFVDFPEHHVWGGVQICYFDLFFFADDDDNCFSWAGGLGSFADDFFRFGTVAAVGGGRKSVGCVGGSLIGWELIADGGLIAGWGLKVGWGLKTG